MSRSNIKKEDDDCKDLECKNVCCISQGQGICILHYNPKLIKECLSRLNFHKLLKACESNGCKVTFKNKGL